ncbi:MAG TPA: helix-turn-helix domain-containing protein, partial [Candidatus Acidoferrales bacterium]|nr:helix-turn-helix domain-containing protein [Candidatus Acidoferrales bacterium]
MRKSNKNRDSNARALCSEEGVAMREFLTKVGDKWTILIVVSLSQMRGCRARFSELEKMISAISQRMLTLTLRNLERDGLITRELFPEVPPRVEYELTGLGKSLLAPTQA